MYIFLWFLEHFRTGSFLVKLYIVVNSMFFPHCKILRFYIIYHF